MTDFPTLVQGESGSPTLVCLPYFGGSARSFCALWPLLPASWSLRAYTMQGIGVGGGAYSLEVAFEQIAQAVRRDVSGAFHLLGHSMGGKLALGAASLGLDGLESVILLAPSPPSPEPMSEASRAAMLARHGTREGALETIHLAAKRPLSPSLLEMAVEDALATSQNDWENWLERGSRQDCTFVLAGLPVPVRIVVGEDDHRMTPDLMKRTLIEPLGALGVPAPPLEVIAGAGHLLPLEAPLEVAQWLTRWLS